MTFELDINELSLGGLAEEVFQQVKVPVQAAMAGRFRELVLQNFGETGTDRPIEWEALRSEKYARKVGRDYATLYVEGKLMDSIEVDPYSPDAASVFTNCEYAAAHQWGDESRNLAARPFFPMSKDGFVTPDAMNSVTEAAAQELERQLA